jgi:hypothetical protein
MGWLTFAWLQLAEHIQMQNFSLHKSLDHLCSTAEITTDTIMAVLDESPVLIPQCRLGTRPFATAEK